MRKGLSAATCLAMFLAQAQAEEIVPLAGCYERIYDAAWLKAHSGQIISRVTLSVQKTSVPQTPGEKQHIVADAFLAMWSGKNSFGSIGACYWEKVGLICNAALSAQETDACKSKADGVRTCRIAFDDAGSFELAQKPEGLLLTVHERLELPGPEDRAEYLYLSPSNAENHAFLLQPVPEARCK
ncbi:hypothetical protein [Methylocystis parvus]|uniref:hypothetical protein n=1 Tax=Methylocystis parvus TaxID=134 RepID=UPI003C7297C8